MQSKVLSAFSNIVRLKLILCLSNGDKNVTQLIKNCGLSQSAVSQHLEKLRNAGLVTTKKEGKEIYYMLIYPEAITLSKDLLTFVTKIH
ncbi:MAG: winged helix-turn-helix transcriptional regulator [Candidatus Levybacteria bacterium]|nr:winged helix-turn-helix transcriptional regulator [Candidatus Levybacteria bacterium]